MTILAAALALGGGAAAKPANSNARGAKSGDYQERHQEQSAPDIDISISLGEAHRTIVRDHYRGNCPPGLARKNNGCLPPGQAKKRYAVGERVPDGVEIVILPNEVILRLPPLPRGYGYRMVDGDLVVVALATLIIADAIGLF